MNKEYLIQYCDLQNEIKKLEEKIDKIHKQTEMVSDVVQNGYKRHAIVYGIDLKRKHRLELLEATLKVRYDKLLGMQIEIENWISKIEKSDIRQIIGHRYIDNMNWLQVQFAMRI